MPCYHIYGGILRSEIEIPELQPAPATDFPTWDFRILGAAAPRDIALQAAAQDEIGAGATATLYGNDTLTRLEHSDTGTFDVAEGGRAIRWYPAPGAPESLARLDLIGRVLATAVQMMGALCLHGSAVAVDGRGIGFLAPKGYGKSTLAVAMTYVGAQLITDDTLAVFPGSPPTCVPGVPSVRLRPDAAGRFERTRGASTKAGPGGRVLDWPPEALRRTEGASLGALYVLAPQAAEVLPGVERERLSPLDAAVSLLAHGKLGALQGARDAAANLVRATQITAATPVYSLRIARDLSQVFDVAREVIAWHRSDGVSA